MIIKRQKGATWGKSVVENLAKDLRLEFPGIVGFSISNLWRMKIFYEIYSENKKLAPLVREISWTKNLLIMEKCKDDFTPEYIGKMQFYLAVLDDKVRLPDENPSVGIIICKTKNKTIVEYAPKESNKPIGVAQYKIVSTLPKELENQLPGPNQVASLLDHL